MPEADLAAAVSTEDCITVGCVGSFSIANLRVCCLSPFFPIRAAPLPDSLLLTHTVTPSVVAK